MGVRRGVLLCCGDGVAGRSAVFTSLALDACSHTTPPLAPAPPVSAPRRERAKGVTFFEAHDSEAVRPMLDVSWAPLLGAFSVLFEEHDDEYFVGLCLEGFVRCAGGCGVGGREGGRQGGRRALHLA